MSPRPFEFIRLIYIEKTEGLLQHGQSRTLEVQPSRLEADETNKIYWYFGNKFEVSSNHVK